jgi:hypothetical protein
MMSPNASIVFFEVHAQKLCFTSSNNQNADLLPKDL